MGRIQVGEEREFLDNETGLKCLYRLNEGFIHPKDPVLESLSRDFFTAYVEAPENLIGKKYTDKIFKDVDCHWGLTFSGRFGDGPYLFGYDYAHFNSPYMDEESVIDEVKDLAKQILAISKKLESDKGGKSEND